MYEDKPASELALPRHSPPRDQCVACRLRRDGVLAQEPSIHAEGEKHRALKCREEKRQNECEVQ
jgi:hypothetical protein